jgi:hypothetical protein
LIRTRDVWFVVHKHNNDGKAAYDANKQQQVEGLISQILGAGLDPEFMESTLCYLGKPGEGAGSPAYRRI